MYIVTVFKVRVIMRNMRSTAGWRGTWNVAVMIDDGWLEFELGLAALYSQYSHALGHTRYTRQNVVLSPSPATSSAREGQLKSYW